MQAAASRTIRIPLSCYARIEGDFDLSRGVQPLPVKQESFRGYLYIGPHSGISRNLRGRPLVISKASLSTSEAIVLDLTK